MNHCFQFRCDEILCHFHLKNKKLICSQCTGDHGVLVGNSGYPLRRYLLIPFLDPATPAEECYNKAQILTRVKVECCFGILKNRFHNLMQPFRIFGPLCCSQVVTAMIVLHNIAIMNRDIFEPLPATEMLTVDGHDDTDETENDNIAGNLTRQHYVETYFS